MRQRELEADQQRGGERGELERRLAPRDEVAGDRAERGEARSRAAGRGRGRESRPRGTGPSPRSRTASRGRPASRRCGPRRRAPRAQGSARGGGSRTQRRSRPQNLLQIRAFSRDAGAPPDTRPTAARAASAANFVHPARARNAPRANADVTSQKPKIRNTGMIASFVFELDTYCVNGYAAHANGSVAREPRPAEAASDERQAEEREQVEGDRRRVRRGQLVPLPAPAEAAGSRGCTTRRRPARTCRRARSPTRSGRSSGSRSRISPSASARPHAFRLPSRGMCPYGDCAVHDPIRADHARVADVDDVRAAHVEADAEADEEDRRRREQPDRPHRTRRARARRARPIQTIRPSR